MQRITWWMPLGLCGLLAFAAPAADVDDALTAIKAVKREGAGNERAAAAWRALVQAGPEAVVPILKAYDGADATAINWFRSAIDAIAENEQHAGRKLPVDKLEGYVKDVNHDPRARTLALDLVVQLDPAARARLLPGMINDPSGGVRREAVAFAMQRIDAASKEQSNLAVAPQRYRELFTSARDIDQVEAIAKKIKDLRGADVDVSAHLGLISRWEVAGPLDNSGLKGFAAPLPKIAAWKEFATGHSRAQVELYQAFGKAKGLNKGGKKDAVYALCRTEFDSPNERFAEIRVATQNAVKIFFNGKEVFAREEYHHGQTLDQHIARVMLQQGRNEIVLKICQDDWTMEWTFPWQFQCRVCDEIGGAVPLKVLTAPNATPVQPEAPKEKK